jgi:3-hydroxymyristoyl/3-hydroxydecanoyl-(acyl carrier protein) dehydratase
MTTLVGTLLFLLRIVRTKLPIRLSYSNLKFRRQLSPGFAVFSCAAAPFSSNSNLKGGHACHKNQTQDGRYKDPDQKQDR